MRNRFHSICPYFAMFPESFVEKWVGKLTQPGETVLDPFCGRGTTPFQSLLMERNAIAADVNPVAYCITKAKTNVPRLKSVKSRITTLERKFEHTRWEQDTFRLPEFFCYAYRRGTLAQLMYLRSRLGWRKSDTDCMIAALTLGALHGENEKSSSYLSNQMPRTISTKPEYSVRFWKRTGYEAPERDVFELLRKRLQYRYTSRPPDRTALVIESDVRVLPWFSNGLPRPIRCVITSPPYLNVTSFEEDQWLRLWFLGGPPEPTYGRISRDDRHIRLGDYWNFISDMWRSLGIILDSNADIVIRMGGKRLNPEQILRGLAATSIFSRRSVTLVHHEQSEIKGRQTDSFRPGATGCSFEVDCHFHMA